MPLKGKHLVVYPCKTLWRALSITHNHTPCIPQRVKTLMLWQKREKLDHIEERLRAIEGGEDYAFANLEELLLVPNIITPPKFKVSDFDKYKGTTCPENHLKMCCRKMGAYTKDEELLIHFFQESLTGVAVTWYANLEPSRVHSWKDLMVAFVRQYQYNFDMVLDRMQLQNMCKKGHG